MLILSLFQWWYLDGWKTFFKVIIEKISNHVDFFSFGTIFKTLFSPFRQIDTGEGGNSIGERLSAFGGRLLSRFIGAIVRSIIAIAGLLTITVEFIFGLAIVILWPFIPLIPLICIYFALSGFTMGIKL